MAISPDVMGPPPPLAPAAPEPAPAEPPASSEKPTPEEKREGISDNRRKQEIGRVSSNLLYRKASALKESKDPLTEGQENIKGLIQLAECDKPPKSVEGGSPIIITRTEKTVLGADENVTYTLKAITDVAEDTFKCDFEAEDDTIKSFDLPRQDIVNAQLLAEGDKVLAEFSGDEQQLLRTYLATLRDPEAPISEGIDGLIKKTATEGGMLTTDDLVSLQRNLEAKNTQPQTPEQKVQNDILIKALGELTTEGNLLDFKNLVDVFGKAGITPDALGKQLDIAEDALRNAKSILDRNPEDETAKNNYQQERVRVFALKQASSALEEGGPLEEYFDEVDRGAVDPAKSKEFVENFRQGNFEKMFDAVAEKQDLTEEEKKNFKEALKKYQGVGILMLLLLLTTAESFKGAVSLEKG